MRSTCESISPKLLAFNVISIVSFHPRFIISLMISVRFKKLSKSFRKLFVEFFYSFFTQLFIFTNSERKIITQLKQKVASDFFRSACAPSRSLSLTPFVSSPKARRAMIFSDAGNFSFFSPHRKIVAKRKAYSFKLFPRRTNTTANSERSARVEERKEN